MPAPPPRALAPATRRGVAWQEVCTRLAAGVFGGYLLTSAVVMFLATFLPLSGPERVISATLPAFVIHVGAILFAFATSRAWTAWAWLLVPAAILAALAFPVGPVT